jgi:DNA-binding transcriptional LysR family regulator
VIEPSDLNLRHIDGAVAVTKNGGIGAAAIAMNLSQPALTQALAKLERLVGHKLFDRGAGGTRLTHAGELFVRRAARAIDYLSDAIRSIRRSSRLPAIVYPQRTVSMTQLRALATVERAGSFAAAAREMGLSQPSVHRAARELELVLGTQFLLHVGQVMRATTQGERLVRGIRLAFAELSAGLDELAAIDLEGAGGIRVGALPLPRASLLPAALARFAPANPNAHVTVVEGPYAELLASLRGGQIDILLGALRDPAPDGIGQEPLFADDLFVVARAGHPLASQQCQLEALAAYPWIVGAHGAPMRAVWDRLFEPAKRPVTQIECGSILTMRGLLLAGDWLALMSLDQFRLEEEAGVLARIGDSVPGSRREIGIAMRKDWLPTSTQSALLAAIRQASHERS